MAKVIKGVETRAAEHSEESIYALCANGRPQPK